MKKTAAALIVILICVFAALTAHASGETFSISDDGKYAILVSYKGNAPEYDIPRTYAGLPVTKIAAGAFSGNVSTYKIIIGDNITDIEPSSFSAMNSLYEFEAEGAYTAVDGVLFTSDKKTLVRYPQARTGSYKIPAGVSVGDHAFSGSALSGVDLSGAARIGDSAFYASHVTYAEIGCDTGSYAFAGSAVRTVRVLSGAIGDYAFSRCYDLEFADISGASGTGEGLFFADTGLYAVKPGNQSVIPAMTYAGCTSLETAPVPRTVTEIKSSAFLGCVSLEHVSASGKIAEDAFDLCDKVPDNFGSVYSAVTVRSSSITLKNGQSVDSPASAAGGCGLYSSSECVLIDGDKITAVREGVAYVYAVSFNGGDCAVITVTVSDGGSVLASDHPYGTGVFNYSYTVPGSPSRIAVTFSSSDRLSAADSLTLSDKNGGVYAVYSGTSSASKTVFIDGDTVKLSLLSSTGGEYGFRIVSAGPVSSLKGVSSVSAEKTLSLEPGQSAGLNASVTPSDASPPELVYISGDDSVAVVSAEGVVTAVSAGVTDVTVYSRYYGKKAVCTVTVTDPDGDFSYEIKPDGVHITGYRGGVFCSIPENISGKTVTAIDPLAFAYSGISVVNVPQTVTCIDASAFDGCFSLVAINVDLMNANYSSVSGALYSKDGKTLYRYPENSEGEAVVPDGVTVIGEFAFNHCIKLESIVLPSSVTEVSGRSFMYCPGLRSVASSGNFTSEDGALFSADKKTLVFCPQNTGAGTYQIPAGTVSVSAFAFPGDSTVKTVMIPASVTSIDERAFSEASSVERFVVNSSNPVYNAVNGALCASDTLVCVPKAYKGDFTVEKVTKIGAYAFYNCRYADTITFKSSVNEIGDRAFGECHGLSLLLLPQSLRKLGDDPFAGCSGLTVYIPDSAAVTSLSCVYVMCGKGSDAHSYCTENGIPFEFSYCSSHGLYTTYSPVKGTLRVTENRDAEYVSYASSVAGLAVKAYSVDISVYGVSLPLGEHIMQRQPTSSERYYLHGDRLDVISNNAAGVYLYRHENIIELYGDPYQPVLSVRKTPDKLEYSVYEEIDATGLELYYRDGTGKTAVVTEGYSLECDTSEPGEKKATVSYGGAAVEFTVTVDPAYLSGTVRITGDPRYGTTLSADLTDVLPHNVPVTYQWYRDGAAIPGEEDRAYTPSAEDVGRKISVAVTGSGKVGGTVTSGQLTVGKGKPQTPPKPAVQSSTETTLTIKPVDGCEYRLGADGGFSERTAYTGLTPGKTYIIYQRYAETATHEASAVSSASYTMPEIQKIVSDVYFLNTANGVCSLVEPGTTVSRFKSNFKDGDRLTVFKNGEELKDGAVGTGCEVRLYVSGKIVDRYTVVMTGDVNGDGKTTMTDYLQIKNRILTGKELTVFAEYACDVNGDGKITITDYLKLKLNIQNGTAPSQNRY